jgi:hypothetical protein
LVRWRRVIPGPGELVFATLLPFLLIGGRSAMLGDPGTPWHLRLGRDILASGTLPRCDTLTFTRAGTLWVDQSWGFDVLLALVVDHAGWSAAVAFTAILLALIYAAMASSLVRDGIAPVVAVVVSLLMAAIGCIHFLVRPHIFTIALVFLTLRVCQKQHERGGWAVAWVPLFTMLLANLHGGFLALPVVVATAALGHAASGPWDEGRRRNTIKFAVAFVASLFTALVNPYGLDLYRHVVHLLVSSGVTSLIEEYQSAPFGKPEARVLEMATLALVGLPAIARARVDRYQLIHALVWLHLALTSIRNAPLFALAAAPVLAELMNGLPLSHRSNWAVPGRKPMWIPALVTSVMGLLAAGVTLGKFDEAHWPLSAIAELNRQASSSRLFHEQDWGGLIAAECQPVRPTYLDDRFELYGKEAILEYIDVLTGGPAWDTVHDRDRIDLVWLKPDRGLAKRLLKDPEWSVLHQDKVSVLFGKKPESDDLVSRTPVTSSSPPQFSTSLGQP